MRALNHLPQCPVDRSPLTENELGPANPIVRSMVDELTVQCVYKEEGCDFQGERQLLALHLKESCSYSDEGKFRGEVDKGKEKVICDTGSGVARDTLSDSVETTTEDDTAKNPDLEASESSSSASKSVHRRVGQLTEQNILLRHRVDTLENVVQVFRKEMSMVKSILDPWMRNATQATRSTPTVHRQTSPTLDSGVVDTSFSGDLQRVPTTPDRAQNERLRSSDVSPAESVTSQPPSISADDLSSYFPDEDEVRVRQTPSVPAQPQQEAPAPQRRRPSHSHHHSTASMSNGMDPYPNYGVFQTPLGFTAGYNMYTPPYLGGNPSLSMSPGGIPTAIPPGMHQPQTTSIDLPELDTSSASILATMQGLHSSLQDLNSLVQEVARKNDVTLALIGGGSGVSMMGGGVVGEVLRLGEEVMGVRASLQGLRMQIHGMLIGGMPNVPNAAGYMSRPHISLTNPASEEEARNSPLPGPVTMQNLNARFGFPGITKL